MESFVGILLLATIVEGFITYVFGDDGKGRKWIRFVSLALGVGVAFAYQIDILAMTGLVAIHPFIGYVVSGLVIGRGSNYLNDIVSTIGSTRK